MTRVAGLDVADSTHVEIKPDYLKELTNASAHYELPAGRVSVAWEKKDDAYALQVSCPKAVVCKFVLPEGVETHIVYQTF